MRKTIPVSRWWFGSPPKFNYLFTGPLPFAENYKQQRKHILIGGGKNAVKVIGATSTSSWLCTFLVSKRDGYRFLTYDANSLVSWFPVRQLLPCVFTVAVGWDLIWRANVPTAYKRQSELINRSEGAAATILICVARHSSHHSIFTSINQPVNQTWCSLGAAC